MHSGRPAWPTAPCRTRQMRRVPPEIPECIASTKPGRLQVRPDRQRLVVGHEGILVMPELFQAAALACVRIGKVRIVECRLVELLTRFAIASRELGNDRT